MKKKLTVCTSIFLILLVVSCGAKKVESATSPGRPNSHGPVFVQEVPVSVTDLTSERSVPGTVEAVVQSNVAAQTSGVVSKVYSKAGDRVKEGQPVFSLDDSQLQLSLKSAETALETAKLNYKISKMTNDQSGPKLKYQLQSAQSTYDAAQETYNSDEKLFKIGGISQGDLTTAKSTLTTAQANLETAKIALSQYEDAGNQTLAQLELAIKTAQVQADQAKLNLTYTLVRAPFTGQLVSINVNPGQYITSSTTAYVLIGLEKEVGFSALPEDVAYLGLGKKATFQVSGKDYQAVISQIPGAPVNSVIPMTAVLKDAKDLVLGSVGNLKYKIIVSNGALVPLSSIQSSGGAPYVFIDVNAKVVLKTVVIIGQAGTQACVTGVSAGDSVIDSPPSGLLNGMAVKVISQNKRKTPDTSTEDKSGASESPNKYKNKKSKTAETGSSL